MEIGERERPSECGRVVRRGGGADGARRARPERLELPVDAGEQDGGGAGGESPAGGGRADERVKAMTLDQKIHEVTWSNPPWMFYYGTAGHVDGTPPLCIPTLVLSDAGSGVA